MSESFKEQLSRVQMMADGSPTWDLSDNDTAALEAVLASHAELFVALEAAKEELCHCADKFGCSMDDSLFGVLRKVNAAIAKARGEK